MKRSRSNPFIATREAPATGQELRREFELDRRSIDEQARTVELSFSSEAEVERYFGIEILDHSAGSIRLGRMQNGAALLVNHDRADQVGVVESVTIGQDRRGRAVVRFGRSARAQEIFQDVVDGIRRLVSVGYRVHRTETTQTGGVETVRVVDWEPFEISLVSIPADDSVGVGRGESEPSRGPNNNSPTTHVNRAQIIAALRAANIAFRDDMTDDELRALLPANPQPAPAPAAQRHADPAPAPTAAPVVTVVREAPPAPSVQDAIAAERARVAGINAIADQMRSNGVTVDASRALGDGSGVEAFRAVAFEAMIAQRNTSYSPGMPGPSRGEVRDMDRFDLAVALRAMAENAPLTGIERELLHEGVNEARAAGIQNPGTLMLPSMYVRRGQRDLTATGTTSVTGDQGGMTVQTNRVGLLDDFFNASVMRQLGATVLTGLVGNLELPRLVAGTAAAKKTENASADEVSPTTANLALTPKRLPAFIDISQQLLMQSSAAIESMIRMHLTNQMLATQEAAFFHGGGTSEANGIAGTSGIGSIAGGTNGLAPAWSHMIALETAVDTQNALGGSLRYATNGQIRGKLKQTLKNAAGTDAGFIITDQNPRSINGYGAEFTNAISRTLTKGTSNSVCSAIFFGNFVDYIIGYWGGLSLELIRDSANAKLGMYTLVANTYYDGGVVRPKSFAAMLDALGA